MKIFIDSADVREIQKCFETKLISGVTTNPTLIGKSGRKPTDVYVELEQMGIRDISMEVTASAWNDMYAEAMELVQLFESATIKLPMTVEGLKVCRALPETVRTNVTLIFNAAQALLAAAAGATYVSPFVGRIDDQGYAGLEVVRSISELYSKQNLDTKVLAASIRTPQRVVRSFYNGAAIVTMPPKVFWQMYNHVLTDQGLQIFEKAYEVIG